jgi:hypothetical protein
MYRLLASGISFLWSALASWVAFNPVTCGLQDLILRVVGGAIGGCLVVLHPGSSEARFVILTSTIAFFPHLKRQRMAMSLRS